MYLYRYVLHNNCTVRTCTVYNHIQVEALQVRRTGYSVPVLVRRVLVPEYRYCESGYCLKLVPVVLVPSIMHSGIGILVEL